MSGDGAAGDGRKIGRLGQGRASHKLTADMTDRGRDKNLPRHQTLDTLGGHQLDMLMAHLTIARRPNSQPWRDWSALAYWPEQFPERKPK